MLTTGGGAHAPQPAAPPHEQAPRRGEEASATVRARATAVGLTGALGSVTPAGANAGGAMIRALHDTVRRDAALAWDTPRLATALTWFERFDAASDGRTHFVPAIGEHAVEGAMWNRQTLDLFDAFIAGSPALGRARGERVSTDVRQSYVSAIRLLRCREAGYDIAPEDVNWAAPLAGKTRKRAEPASTQRGAQAGVGLRMLHILAAAAAGFDRKSAQGKLEWAAVIGGHNLLLRGGEIGTPDDAHYEPHRVLRGRSLRWQPPCRSSGGRPWLIVHVVPIKDPTCSHKGYPTPVCRRHDGALGADPACAYDAFAATWWQRVGAGEPFPVDEAGRPCDGWWERASESALATALAAPLFTRLDGKTYRTSDTSQLCKRVARLAGVDATRVGAKALRIGGATDCREYTGEAGKGLVKRRGRWDTDIAEVYQRELVGTQLELSARMGSSFDASLEEVVPGWVQPA